MTSALDDEDLSLSISTPQVRRGSRESSQSGSHAHTPAGPLVRASGQAPKPLTRLGQYDVVKTLGEGSFGKVKLAIHQVSGQKVALKIIGRRKLVTRDMAGRIEREIQYLQLLRHPHIIKLFTVITTSTDIIMVLEYAGGELFDYIVQNGKMPEDKARKFFQQIVCAVEYCHRHKIVHRDLKPENLLLDEQLNVKIADFGLSNIMTDGNFLKTSCGSPNYAAPEVISGKLYAGPEVDVWSCGVILYVLLVGRLPFDDDYIPALFKKIAQGNYAVPDYLSSGAVRLIKKMLQVNPVNRITIQEIRQDPWFVKNLAEYLQPPVEDFKDTGFDPNMAIVPSALAQGKPAVVREKLHQSIVGKLGKTMGYAPDDVQEALVKDEPSAIKDAYLIVRENHLMKANPSLAQDQPAFMAQSPPAFNASMLTSPRSPVPPRTPQTTSPLSGIDHPRHGSTASSNIMEARSPASTVAILPSSLPDYHAAFMKGHVNRSQPPAHPDDMALDMTRPRTKEEQEAFARRLKPHSKSSSNLGRHSHEKPEPMTSLPEGRQIKKPRPTKWQFGIRSRNPPADALVAIYRALQKMGARWEVPRAKEPGDVSGEGSPERRADHRDGSNSPEYSDSDPGAGTDPEYASREEQERRRARRRQAQGGGGGGGRSSRGRDRHGRWNDWGYTLPEDPWVIHARFKKSGMYPPDVLNPLSARSSQVNLRDARGAGGHPASASVATPDPASANPHATDPLPAPGTLSMTALDGEGSRSGAGTPRPGTSSSTSATATATAAAPAAAGDAPRHPPDDCAWVYVTIQIYNIEKDFFLVDFKCAGYERLVRKFARTLAGPGPHPDVVPVAVNDDDEETAPFHADGDAARPEANGYHRGHTGERGRERERERDHGADERRNGEGVQGGDHDRDDRGHDGDDDGDDDDDDDDDAVFDAYGEPLVGVGRTAEEKYITSPFPFLEIASRLITQLADANEH